MATKITTNNYTVIARERSDRGNLQLCWLLLVYYLAMFSIATAQETTDTEIRKAVFAGGCFWCMEPPFEKTSGVLSAVSGYTGGTKLAPTYKEVTGGNTGHYEAIQVTYNPKVVSYKKLLSTFWKNVDPLNSRGQFCDSGSQYLSAIFYSSPEEETLAKKSAAKIKAQLKEEIATKILPLGVFYEAEEYHQDYYKKNAFRYKFYRFNCGRDSRLKELWGQK